MNLNFHYAKFLTSAISYPCHHVNQNGIEIAFIGYSNSGKSTAINFLTNKKKISRVSKSPGRTNMINFFYINSVLRFVDLPGYGYSIYHKYQEKEIYYLILKYLKFRKCLKGIILFIDIRRLLREMDKKMLNFLKNKPVNLVILLTKCDKINQNNQNKILFIFKKKIALYSKNIEIILFSSFYKKSKKDLLNIIQTWII